MISNLSNSTFLTLMVLILLNCIQCKKKNETNTSSPPPSNSGTQDNGKFEFKANGTLYKFNKMVGAYENNSSTGPALQISASGNTGYHALGSISNFTAIETNSITSGFALTFFFNNVDYGILPGSSMYAGSHGTIQVTEIKTLNGKRYAKGIFSGVAYRNATDSLVITEGVFQDHNF
jgi:hypothetical protein